MDEDFKIEPINMGQAMHIASMGVNGLILQFINPTDSEEDKVKAAYICLVVFFHALCEPAKHKDKMISVLEIIIQSLKEAQ